MTIVDASAKGVHPTPLTEIVPHTNTEFWKKQMTQKHVTKVRQILANEDDRATHEKAWEILVQALCCGEQGIPPAILTA